ncbi:MAG: aminotransferase class III-fold pyridoxal phosphate-dependent enzyme, partial [Cytophagaceae bacterium]
PVCCAASLATLETIEHERLIESVAKKEKLFRELLIHPAIKSIRSKGLLMAVEFESFDVVKTIIKNGLAHGIVTDWFLHCSNSIRIAPPLIITESQIKEACTKLLNCVPK